MTGRLVLLPTSPRVAPGLLAARPGTSCARGATVLAADDHPLVPYLEAEGVAVETGPAEGRARTPPTRLLRSRPAATVVWLVGADGDPELGLALGTALQSGAPPPSSSRCCPARTTCRVPACSTWSP